jgi:hypothetical protein
LKPKHIKKSHKVTAADHDPLTTTVLNSLALSPGREIINTQIRPKNTSAVTSTKQANVSPTEKLTRRPMKEKTESNCV